MKVARRWVLGSGVGALLAVGFGSAALPFTSASHRLMVQRIIYYYVPGIIFDGNDLTEFAEYIRQRVLGRHTQGFRKLGYYGGSFLLYHSAFIRDLIPTPAEISSIDQAIVDAFFLCTDFWETPYTAGRTVTLVRSPDPYDAGCSNPLANLTLAAAN